MDEENHSYYNFLTDGTGSGDISASDYLSFSYLFERNQNYTKYLYMDIYEADTKRKYDDHIGKCQINLSYDQKNDKSNITWDDYHGHHSAAVNCGAADMTEVFYSQTSNDGDVTPKFGFRWE